MLDERVLGASAPRGGGRGRARGRLPRRSARGRSRRRPAASCSPSLPPGRIEVLEIGGSRGYSSIWLAAGARVSAGASSRSSTTPSKCAAWRERRRRRPRGVGGARRGRRLDDARADRGRLRPRLPRRREGRLRGAVRARATTARAGGLVVADNVLSHVETLGAYSAARQADGSRSLARRASPSRRSDRGLESPDEPRIAWTRSPLDGAVTRAGRTSSAPPPSARSAYAGATAERRWSDLSDDSTGSGGTSG